MYCRKSHTLITPSSPPDAIKCCSLQFQLITLTSLSCALSSVILHAEFGAHRTSQIRRDLSTEHEQNTCNSEFVNDLNYHNYDNKTDSSLRFCCLSGRTKQNNYIKELKYKVSECKKSGKQFCERSLEFEHDRLFSTYHTLLNGDSGTHVTTCLK